MNTTISKLSAVKAFLQLSFFVIIFLCFSSKNAYSQQTCTSGGTPTTYGAGSWIGYVYDHNGNGNPVTNPFATYKGFVTETEQFDRNWGNGNNSKPSCAINGSGNNFAVRYRMNKNFPCGYYTFTIGADDGVRLSIDGGATWLISGWVDQGYTVSTSLPVLLNGSTNLVLEYYEKAGDARVSFSYTAQLSSIAVNAGSDVTICKGESVLLNGTSAPASNCIVNGSGTLAAPSCNGVYVNNAANNNDHILNFSTSNGSTNITNNGSGYSANSYGDFTSQVVTVLAGNSFNISVYAGNSWSHGFRIWIDWNNNGTFEGTESVWSGGSGTATYTGSINVPAGQMASRYRIRVRCVYNTIPGANDACTSFGFGEVEDYTLQVNRNDGLCPVNYAWNPTAGLNMSNILNPMASPLSTTNYTLTATSNGCSVSDNVTITVTPTLNPGIISDPQTICHGETPELLTGTSPTGGGGSYAYQWEQQANCTGAWVNAPGSNTSANYQPGVLSESTCFRRKVTSYCGVAYSKPVTISSDLKLHYSFDKRSEPTQNVVLNTDLNTGWAQGYHSNILFNEIAPPTGINSPTVGFNRNDPSGYWYSYGDYAPQIPGETYTVSLYVKTLDANFQIRYYTADNAEIGRMYGNFISVPNDGNWHRIEWPSFVNPANSASESLSFNYTYAGAIGDPNTRTWFCAPQMEKKDHATPFVIGTLNASTVLDNSGNGYNGTLQLATTPKWIANGIDGGAYEFDGGDVIDFPNPGLSNVSQEWTVSAWINVADVAQNSQFLVQGMNNGNYVLFSNTSKPLLYLNAGGNDYYSYGSSSIVANTWSQIVYVFNNSTGLKDIYLNGVSISTGGPNLTSTPLGIAANMKLGTNFKGTMDEVRIYGKALTSQEVKDLYEAKSLKIKLPNKSNLLAASGENATCKVKGTNWVHFYETTTGNLIGSVNANGGDLGDVTLEVGTNSGGAMFACNTSNAPQYQTAYMGRNWHVNSSTYPSSANFSTAASIRLPYANGELTAMNTIASGTTTGNPQDNNATAPQIMLTKISGGSVDGNPTNDCSSTILGIAQSGSGTLLSSYSGFLSAGYYADFGVAQFSEMFLHKNINTSPLPVKLTNFSANCENNVTLSWTTASEQNSDRFIVEKSRDGQTWSIVGEQAAAGNSNTILNYNFTDVNSWNATSYYRLRQIDFNGAEEIYGPISVSCKGNESSMTVYPNPNSGSFTIEIASTEMYNNAQLFLTDLTGKVITSQKVNVANGTTQILMDHLDLKMGTYLVTLRGADQQLKPVKVMVTK